MNLRLATPDDAPRIAEIHVRGWQVAYADILPAELLAGLSVGQAMRGVSRSGTLVQDEGSFHGSFQPHHEAAWTVPHAGPGTGGHRYEPRIPHPMDEPLDEIGVRVLGALMEKEITTPDNYPLTLNALKAACNQTSNREPVMALSEDDVSRALDDLARRKLARGVHRGDGRSMRYRQEIGEALHLHEPERAVLGVLMLRGPQTVGEIRTRTARMAEFADLRHVEITLESLSALPTPLVRQLPRRPGQKEVRWAHLLSGEPPAETSEEDVARAPGTMREPVGSERIEGLEAEIRSVREEVAELRAQLEAFRRQFE